MRRELEQLKTEGRTEIAQRLLIAREHGDIRENADYDAAKNAQGLMEARIRTLEHRLKDPEILEEASGEDVQAGTLVTLRPLDEDDPDEETYLIAHAAEERAPGVRTVTATSPLGAAMMGRKVGDAFTYDAPAGTFGYAIVKIEPHKTG